MSDNPPDWAIDRALRLTSGEHGAAEEGYDAAAVKANQVGFPTTFAFARYIAEHEEPPVDPLQECLRETFGAAAPEFVAAFKEALEKRRLQVTPL